MLFNLRILELLMVLSSLLVPFGLPAEIEQVTIKWTPGLCQTSCIRGLERQFHRVKEVTYVEINGSAGLAILRWDSKIAFSYRPIETAMAMIGLSIDDMNITVRGNITYDGRDVILTSLGDRTQFYLVSAPPMMALELHLPHIQPLNVQTKRGLIEAGQNHQVVSITGPLFQPEKAPPFFLVVDSLK